MKYRVILCKKKLGVTVSGIERIHRLGTKKNEKARPVILKLLDFRDKVKILKNCPKLKGSNISVSEDFSARIRNVRKKLWDSCKPNRDRQEKIKLIFDKIKVNDQLFIWDDEVGDKVPLSKPRQKNVSE